MILGVKMKQKQMKKINKRNPIAFDLLTNGLYKQKVIKNKKAYNRKKMKKGKELLKVLSHYFSKYVYDNRFFKTII